MSEYMPIFLAILAVLILGGMAFIALDILNKRDLN